MEPLTIIDGVFNKDFRLPAVSEVDELVSGGDVIHNKEFTVIFLLTNVLPFIVNNGLHSPSEGMNTLVIVDDLQTFKEKFDVKLFQLICHKSLTVHVVDNDVDVESQTKMFHARNANNALFMIFNQPRPDIAEIVSSLKPSIFSSVEEVSKTTQTFQSFTGIQYSVPGTCFLRLFVHKTADESFLLSKYDTAKMLNMMVDVKKCFTHELWVEEILTIYETLTNNLPMMVRSLKSLLE